jgi:hypothetical protein
MAKRENPEMTSVRITKEERYPDYVLSNSRHADLHIEVEAAVLERWQRVVQEYKQAQAEMEEAYGLAEERLRRERAIAKAAKAAAEANARLEALQREGLADLSFHRGDFQVHGTVTGRLNRPEPQPQTQVSSHRNTDVLREMGHDL